MGARKPGTRTHREPLRTTRSDADVRGSPPRGPVTFALVAWPAGGLEVGGVVGPAATDWDDVVDGGRWPLVADRAGGFAGEDACAGAGPCAACAASVCVADVVWAVRAAGQRRASWLVADGERAHLGYSLIGTVLRCCVVRRPAGCARRGENPLAPSVGSQVTPGTLAQGADSAQVVVIGWLRVRRGGLGLAQRRSPVRIAWRAAAAGGWGRG